MCLTPTKHHRPQGAKENWKTKLHQVTDIQDDPSGSSDDEYVYLTGDKSKIPMATVKVNNVEVEMVVDTGASTDIIDETAFDKVNRDKMITLQATTRRLFTYGSNEQLSILGEFDCDLAFKQERCNVRLYVMKGNHGSLLSYKSAVALGILNLQINSVTPESSPHEALKKKFICDSTYCI